MKLLHSDPTRDPQRFAQYFGPTLDRAERERFPFACERWLRDGDEAVPVLVVVEMRGSKAPGRTRAHAGKDDTRHWRPRAPDAKLTDRAQAVASVSRIVREHPEIETVLVGDGRTIYAKESKMVTVDDVDDEMLFRDEEAENVKEAVERVVRLRVDLAGIMLRTSDPTDVYLEDVNFAGTGLRDTQLTAARLASDLKNAEFTDTVLRGSNLRTAELENIREDLWAVLSVASHEVPAIRAALVEGRIDGGTYYGECACLIGTIANARGCDVYSLGSLRPAPDRPIEHLFMRLDRGDTPQTNPVAKLIVQWIDAWRTRFQHEHHKQESSSV